MDGALAAWEEGRRNTSTGLRESFLQTSPVSEVRFALKQSSFQPLPLCWDWMFLLAVKEPFPLCILLKFWPLRHPRGSEFHSLLAYCMRRSLWGCCPGVVCVQEW